MADVNTEELKQVVRYLRRGTKRALDGRVLKGVRIEPDEPAGRHAPCWLHRAASIGPRPVVFEIHGGGFSLGDARKEDALRQWICDSFDVHVVGLDYRLTPEYPYPAALEDVLASIRHVATGVPCAVDSNALFVLGYSAGASLAVASALALEGDAQVRLAGLDLHYPFLDAATPPDAEKTRAMDLPCDMMVAFNDWYVADADPRDPLISPVFATDAQLAGLPKTVMYPVIGDLLCELARRLRVRMELAGVPVFWHLVGGMYHGYIEDAADVETYTETSLPQTIAARPDDFVKAASETVKASLEELLGPVVRYVPFPGTEVSHD